MNFIDATNNMMQGKRMVRSTWSGYYLTILSNQNYIWNVGNSNVTQTINAYLFTPSIEDILATDWIVKIN